MHWAVKMKETKRWRSATYIACMQKQRPREAMYSVKLTLVRGSSKECDIDNHIASFKPIIDGLRDAKIISDDTPNVVREMQALWVKTSPKQGFVQVIVESI